MSTTAAGAVNLVLLTALDTETQMQVREIRNEETVRRRRQTDRLTGVTEHLGWISRLKRDDTQMVFAVLDARRQALGAAGLQAMDALHKRTDFFYDLTAAAGKGLETALVFSCIDGIFNTLAMEKITCEVIEGDAASLALHRQFLFQEEGFRRSHIVKNGARAGVHLLGLTQEEWRAGRPAVQARCQEMLERFPVSVRWAPAETAQNPVDQIEAARAKNNLNWMSILRLALEKSPAAAQSLVAEITRMDREISALTEKIAADSL